MDRSPDAYELHNAREFVAVNLEYFLLDPSYACRRPSLQQYLRAHFDWAPARTEACPQRLPYLNAGSDYARQPLGWIDPAQVYEIDYLFAEANDNWVSRWGHSMLRRDGRPARRAGWTWTTTWCCPTARSSATCNCPVGTA